MYAEELQTKISLPKGAQASVAADGTLTVQGSKGTVTRRLYHKRITLAVEGTEVVVTARDVTRREKKMVYTFQSHIKNLLKGVTEGHEYQLKICSGHFPMTVSVKGAIFEVKNFIGESVPRTVAINPNTKIVVEGTVVTVTGNDIEATSQMAARIEQLCRRSNFDRRIFQDGIYITHKDGQAI